MEHRVELALTTEDHELVFALRYRILRKPWDQPVSSASDELDPVSINAFIREGNRAIACGRLQDNGNGKGQIRYMAVDEDKQGMGLGKKILEFLSARARERNMSVIELQARENAVPFYLSQGYSIIGPGYLLWGIIPHFIMSKRIDSAGADTDD